MGWHRGLWVFLKQINANYFSVWSLHVCPCHIETSETSLTFSQKAICLIKVTCLYKSYFTCNVARNRPRCVNCPNMPVCVCACYLRQLLTQLRAGGPWHQCGWREARYWRSVQRVLNPGLLEGSLSFSHSFLSLSPFLSSLTKCLQSFLCDSVSVWQVVWDVCYKRQI